MGLPPRSTNPDDGYTVAVLKADSHEIWGLNGSKPISFPVNAISKTHAEIDALDQLARIRQASGVQGGRAVMTVDRAPCPACYPNGGIRSGVRAAGLDELKVIYPGGSVVIKP